MAKSGRKCLCRMNWNKDEGNIAYVIENNVDITSTTRVQLVTLVQFQFSLRIL